MLVLMLIAIAYSVTRDKMLDAASYEKRKTSADRQCSRPDFLQVSNRSSKTGISDIANTISSFGCRIIWMVHEYQSRRKQVVQRGRWQ
jgi:hypothetical protein